jgi:signal transduction histidine kinase
LGVTVIGFILNWLAKFRLSYFIQRPAYMIAAFALLLLIVLISMVLLQRTSAERDRLVTTVETDGALYELLLALRRVESPQRGYLLTGDDDFLSAYRQAVPAVASSIEAIRRGVEDEPEQSRRIEALKPLIEQKLAEMAETVKLFRAGRQSEALAMLRTDIGVHYMDEIRKLIFEIKAANEDQRARQYSDTRSKEQWLFSVNIVVVTLILAIAVLSVFVVQRANLAMQKAQNVLRDANTQLEASVAARTAELTAANAEIQSFAYIVSHDLRSPLVNIMGFTSELEELKRSMFEKRGTDEVNGVAVLEDPAETAAEGASDEELEKDFDEALGFIKASITKMDRLIHSILTISREGSRTLQAEKIDLNEMFDTILSSAAHQVQEAEADISVASMPTIVSDRLAVEQVFSNLIDNALKYLRSDEKGRINVNCARRNDRVVIEIEDNGRGIAEKDKGRVFELFRRAGTQDRPGNGMGLAHTRALVRRLGGTITLDSALGKGSTFRVSLPQSLPDQRTRMISA